MLLNVNTTISLSLSQGKVLITVADAISNGEVIGNPTAVVFNAEGKLIPVNHRDLQISGSRNLKELFEDVAYRVAAVLYRRGIVSQKELEEIRRGEGIQLVALNPQTTKAGFMAAA